MRCPACKIQNADDAARCHACGNPLSRRSKRRNSAEVIDAPTTPEAERRNAASMRAYRICLLGLIPGPGLVLGPVSIAMAIVARIRGAKVPGFAGRPLTTAVILLGALISATQWAGATLVWLGLRGRP